MESDLKTLSNEIRSCSKCSLCSGCKQTVIGRGSLKPVVLIVGEAPGEQEDLEGRPFVGRSGQLLDQAIQSYKDLAWAKNVAISNVVKCRPPDNRKPTPEEMSICGEWLEKQMELLNPELIILLGATSLNYFFPNEKISKSIGKTFTKDGRKFVPFFHPSFILRGSYSKEQWIKDFDRVEFFLTSKKTSEEIVADTGPNPTIRGTYSQSPSNSEIEGKTLQPFVHLHNHSEQGSLLDVFRDNDLWAKDLKAKGFSAAAITDHGSLSGLYYAQKSLLKENIKPILGLEAYLKESATKSSHILLLIKNEIGWQNLLELHRLAQNSFNRHPRIKLEDLLRLHEGLICTSACVSGFIGYRLKNQLVIDPIIKQIHEVFKDNFYLEVQPPSFDLQKNLNKILLEKSKEFGIKLMISCDTHYIFKEDKPIHNAIKCLAWQAKQPLKECGFTGNTYYNMTSDEISAELKEHHPDLYKIRDELFGNTVELAAKCNFILPDKIDAQIPLLENPEVYVARKIQENMHLIEGLYSPEIIKDRLNLELNRIKSKNFLPYFEVVGKIFEFAREQGIPCGPGRGSSGGSLLAYLMGITQVDPIKYDLMFDRFYSEARKDPPDIDSDFGSIRQQEIVGELKRVYGQENVVHIATFGTWKGRGAFRDACRIHEIPLGTVNSLSKLIPSEGKGVDLLQGLENSSALRDFQKEYPEVMETAIKLDGHIRQKGSHAAGVVICQDLPQNLPIEFMNKVGEANDIPGVKGKKKEIERVLSSAWEKDALGELGVIKLDLLSLTALDDIDNILKAAGLGWDDLPMEFDDDPSVYKLLQEGKLAGLHQLEGGTAATYTLKIKPKNFQQILDINSLSRPGPLSAGTTDEYVARLGGKEWDYYHPLIKEITEPTQGLIIYQEQVMRILHDVGGFSWGDTEKARKIIGKSQGEAALNELREPFVKGAELNGLKNNESNDLFDKMVTFGGYSFNAAHTIAYSMISYWQMWLKTKYPVQSYFAFMSAAEGNKLTTFILEAKSMGIETRLPSIKRPKSETTFDLEKKIIYLGLNKIKNIGNKDANKILSCGKNFDKVRRECKSQYPVLVECGYFDEKESNRRHLFQKKELQENTLFRWAENKEELKDADWSEEEKLSRLRKYIPWPRGKEELKATKFDDLVKTVDSINGETLDNSAFLVKGWVTEVKVYNNNWGKSLDLVFDDGSSQIKLTAYSYIYEKNNKLLDSIIAGDYNLSVICAVHPFYLQRGNSISKEGKLNLLWIDKITSEVPENILKGLKKDEIELSDREYLVTNISYGTSKKGNKYAAVETCDKDDKIWSGIVMIKSDIAPQYGWIIKGSWSEPNGGFFRGDYN